MVMYITIDDIAVHLNITTDELLLQYPRCETTVSLINRKLTVWVTPNVPKGDEQLSCMKDAGLSQWDYQDTSSYKGIMDASPTDFKVGNYSQAGTTNTTKSQQAIAPDTLLILKSCNLTYRGIPGDTYDC